MDDAPVRAAILDYGMGNLFSVKHACERAGMHARITADKPEVLGADVVILPGVGAFGDAMEALRRLDLVAVLRADARAAAADGGASDGDLLACGDDRRGLGRVSRRDHQCRRGPGRACDH